MIPKLPGQKRFTLNPLVNPDFEPDSFSKQVRNYVLAFLSVGVALVASFIFYPTFIPTPGTIFFAATAIIAWYVGVGPAILSSLLSVLLIDYFFSEPIYHIAITNEFLSRSSIFIFVALLMNWPSTRRKRTEEMLRQQREWFRVCLKGIGDAVIATDTEARIVFLNPVAETLTGWTSDEALGKNIDEVFRIINEYSGQSVRHPIYQVLAEQRVVGLANHTVLIARDGIERPIDDSGSPIHDPKGALIGAVMVFRDISERQQAEAQLRESEARFRLMAETVPDILYTNLPDGSNEYISPRFYEYTGLSADDPGQPNVAAALHPDDDQKSQSMWSAAKENRLSFEAEYRFRSAHGSYRWFFTRARPLLDEDGDVVKWVGSSTDIHDIKQAQENQALLNKLIDQQHQRLRNLVANVPGVVWESWGEPDKDDQRINFVSDYVEQMLGYSVDEWLNIPNFWLSIVHPEDREQATATSRETYNSLQPGINRFRWVAKDGKVIPVETRSMALVDENGKPIGMRGVTMDISEREQAERERLLLFHTQQVAIRQKEEAFAILDALFSSAPIGLAFFDREIRFQRINLALAEINGLPPEAHIGHTPRELLPDVEIEGTEEMFLKVLETGQSVSFETSGKTPASPTETHYWFANYYPIRLAEELLGIGALVMDITERKRIEKHRAELLESEQEARAIAEEANRLKLTFLAMISHELRTPLTSIKGFATTLLADDITWDVESQRDFIAIISEESDKLTDLIEQLLDLSRLEAGTLGIVPMTIPMMEIVSESMAQLEMITASHQLKIDTMADFPPVMADPRRIGQVLVNLVNNASKYSPLDTEIHLSAEQKDDFLQINVADHGPGIAPEERHLIFEAFRQVGTNAASTKKGAGLGLAICKGLVEAHGGKIWVQDTDIGTTISFTVPVAG